MVYEPPELFQSTSSVWRTTWVPRRSFRLRIISIHVLRVEDDFPYKPDSPASSKFQSTSSVWRTTHWIAEFQATDNISIHVLRVEDDALVIELFAAEPRISIHVLRVEDDPSRFDLSLYGPYFNPRPPCGGRRIKKGLTQEDL